MNSLVFSLPVWVETVTTLADRSVVHPRNYAHGLRFLFCSGLSPSKPVYMCCHSEHEIICCVIWFVTTKPTDRSMHIVPLSWSFPGDHSVPWCRGHVDWRWKYNISCRTYSSIKTFSAEFILGNKNMYLHFVSFLKTVMVLVVEILPHRIQGRIYFA